MPVASSKPGLGGAHLVRGLHGANHVHPATALGQCRGGALVYGAVIGGCRSRRFLLLGGCEQERSAVSVAASVSLILIVNKCQQHVAWVM